MIVLEKFHESARAWYNQLNEHFIRKLLTLDSFIDNNEADMAKNYSRLIHALNNVNKTDDINLAYFLRFAPFYLLESKFENQLLYYEQLVAITSMGLINQRINEVKLLLKEQKLSDVNHDSLNWIELLYIETMRLFLRVVRKGQGFGDIDNVNESIKKLIQIQQDKESLMVEKGMLSPREVGVLVVLYNAIASISDVNKYLETGNPSQISVRIDRYHDNIKEACRYGVDARFKYSIDNIIKGLEVTVKNSIWKRLQTGKRTDRFIEIMVDRGNEKPIFELLPSQVDAFERGIDRQLSSAIVIDMHTSAGKSFLAHFLIAQSLELDNDGMIGYVVPTRALVHQTLYDLRNTFRTLDYNIKATIPAYEIDAVEEKLLDEEIDILVSTPEKLSLLIRSDHPSVKNLSFVIVDEAHNISDTTRGPALEFLLATLRRKKDYLRIVLLTPFIKDENRAMIAEWLGGDRGLPLYSKWRPTRQIVSLLTRYKPGGSKFYKFEFKTIKPGYNSGGFDYPIIIEDFDITDGSKPNSYKTMATMMAKRFIKSGAVLIMCNSPVDAENQAIHLADSIDVEAELSKDLEILVKFVIEELGQSHALAKCLQKKVAFHHSGLPEEVKIVMEKLIANAEIDYVVGTTTLAQGMNFPISTVIIKTIYFPEIYKRNRTMRPEVFWNIAGRAGRVFKDLAGRIIFLAMDHERKKEIEGFIDKHIEGINSAVFETIKNIDELSVEFDMNLVRDNQALSSLLQFISGTIRLINENEASDDLEVLVDEILRLSLAYKQLSERGENEKQKLLTIVKKYLAYLRGKNDWEGIASLVDRTGFSSMTVSYLLSIKKELPDFKNMSLNDLILSDDRMVEMIDILSKIPEISLGVKDEGPFNPKLVAKITNAWILGYSLTDIHEKLLKNIYGDIRESIRYIYRTITGKVSWGMGAMQSIALAGNKDDTDDILDLPSMIYYGVPNARGVALRMAGVPRTLAIKITKGISDDDLKIDEQKLSGTRKWLRNLSNEKWNDFSKGSTLSGAEWKRIWELIEA